VLLQPLQTPPLSPAGLGEKKNKTNVVNMRITTSINIFLNIFFE
jgi:hypothetical protein